MSEQRPEKDDVWRRKSDGAQVTILSVGGSWETRRTVVHQGSRRVYTEYGPFLKKYEFVSRG